MRSVKITVRPPDGTRQRKKGGKSPGVLLFGRNMHRFGAAVVVVILFMAIIIWLSKIVQAAPFVNRLLEREKKEEARRIF